MSEKKDSNKYDNYSTIDISNTNLISNISNSGIKLNYTDYNSYDEFIKDYAKKTFLYNTNFEELREEFSKFSPEEISLLYSHINYIQKLVEHAYFQKM